MNIILWILSIPFFIMSISLSLLFLQLRDKNVVISYRKTMAIFNETIANLIDFFMQERGIYDYLIDNIDLTNEEYLEVHKNASEYILKNIPRTLQKQVLKYMTKDQYFMFISQQIYSNLNDLYSRSIDETDVSAYEGNGI
jgi:hypothetical protein